MVRHSSPPKKLSQKLLRMSGGAACDGEKKDGVFGSEFVVRQISICFSVEEY